MFYLSLLVFLAFVWLLPWWVTGVLAFFMSFFFYEKKQIYIQIALGAGCAWMILAFISDAQVSGVVAKRIEGLLSLPAETMSFFLTGFVGFLTALLWGYSGFFLRKLAHLPGATGPQDTSGGPDV